MNKKTVLKFLPLLILGTMAAMACSPVVKPAATPEATPVGPSPVAATLSPSLSRRTVASPPPSTSPISPSLLVATAEPSPFIAPFTVVPQRDSGKIVFVARWESRQELYSMSPDGSNRTCLTCDHEELGPCEGKAGPILSPDGSKIAFLCEKPPATTYPDIPYPDIYVLDLDSSNLICLGSGYAFGWFPDSRRIVLDSFSRQSIQIVQADGTLISSWPTRGVYLIVSPDSGKLAYIQEADGSQESLHAINLETGEKTLLLESLRYVKDPAWLVDSQRIVYIAYRAGETNVYVFDLATQAEMQVARAADDRNAALALSPDGSKIAFTCADKGRHGLCVSGADGSNRRTLPVVLDIPVQGLSWSPDGTSIVFLGVERIEQDLGIYVIAADGTGLVRLTEGSGWGVDWGP